MHHNNARIFSTFLAMVTVAGCQADPTTSPQFSREGNSSIGAPLACNFPVLRQGATAFFSSPSDSIFQIIDDVELLWLPGGTAAADNKAFDGMARLAAARGTTAQAGTGADGEQVIKGFIGCTSITAVPSDVDSLDVAINAGALEVRAGLRDGPGPVLAFRATPGHRTWAFPMWGGESSSWSATLGQRTLLFGYERPVSSFTTEPPVSSNGVPFTGFELSSFPSGLTFPATAQLTTGICIDQFQYGLSRLLHDALPSSAILALSSPGFCTGGGPGLDPGSSWAGTIAPSGITRLGGVGGGLSGLSPSGAVVVTPANDIVVFTQQPSDGIVFRPMTPPVTVRAQTQQGTPIGGVLVTITVVPSGKSYTATTQPDGTATFANIRIPVAGTYTLTATATLAETSLLPATSRQFKIRA